MDKLTIGAATLKLLSPSHFTAPHGGQVRARGGGFARRWLGARS
jgi:hypothetical protein